MKILIGNTFPISLIERKVVSQPAELSELKQIIDQGSKIFSFWGHKNTIEAARSMLGFDPTPNTERPALTLDADGYPQLEGHSFECCWVMVPQYVKGYRPALGEEVSLDKIVKWQLIKMEWI